jgi:hypothetical protein
LVAGGEVEEENDDEYSGYFSISLDLMALYLGLGVLPHVRKATARTWLSY